LPVLTQRLEASCFAPQTMAFAAEAGDLLALREAMRAALERAEIGPLRALWQASSGAYKSAHENAKLRVPRETVARACDALEATWNGPESKDLNGLDGIDVRGALARVRAACGESLAVHPERWFSFERAAAHILQRGAGASGLHVWMSANALAELLDGPPPANALGPWGELSWVRAVRFFLEDSDEEVRAEDIRNITRDEARFPDPETGEPARMPVLFACDEAARRCALVDILEALVGPYVPSEGPGPFLGPPAASLPLVDPAWDLLPLFRAVGSCFDFSRGARLLVGDALDEALREVSSAAPDRAWWGDFALELHDELYRRPREGTLWKHWDDALPEWPLYRDRFLRLLRGARASGRGVLLVPGAFDDQGPGGPPPLMK
jgi:hypothetical protein